MMGTYGHTSPRLAKLLASLPPERVARAKAFQGRPVNTDLSQVDPFHTEVDADAQRILAAEFGIPEDVLLRTARALAEHTREDLPLLADEYLALLADEYLALDRKGLAERLSR